MSHISAIILFSPRSCTDTELLNVPKCKDLSKKLNITWHQSISKTGPNGFKKICELKIT